MSEITEDEIIDRVKDGETELLGILIKKYQDKVFRYTYSNLGNYDDALEATQDIFVSVFRSIGKFRGESKFSTWLYSITSNYCKNYKRKRGRVNIVSLFRSDDEEYGELPIEDEREDLEKQFEMSNAMEMATDELNKLPDDYRSILILREIEELSYEEISEVLNISLSNVKVRIHRGRAMLKQRLVERGVV
ncbi:MAG: RNA polymerase sigma factor [Spirochaetes bacterium]|jgi:RNA polymerase sigma-70 factor (ECF subfamily)|nr:RNA polymerase sigma factor [Spirochaetota bacterium]